MKFRKYSSDTIIVDEEIGKRFVLIGKRSDDSSKDEFIIYGGEAEQPGQLERQIERLPEYYEDGLEIKIAELANDGFNDVSS